jgi:hypothetical protein
VTSEAQEPVPPPDAVEAPIEAPAEPPAVVTATPAPPEPSALPEGGALGKRVVVDEWPRESRADAPRKYEGFSARVSASLGYANAIRDLAAAPTEVTGLDGSITLDLGGALRENLIAYGRVGGFALNHASGSDSANAGSAFFALAGAGARYHFLPFDWYASGTLALVLMSVTNDIGKADNAEPGFGVQLETGKQWPAGSGADDVSIGLGLRASYVRCSSSGDVDEPWIGKALSLVFSTSYN